MNEYYTKQTIKIHANSTLYQIIKITKVGQLS